MGKQRDQDGKSWNHVLLEYDLLNLRLEELICAADTGRYV